MYVTLVLDQLDGGQCRIGDPTTPSSLGRQDKTPCRADCACQVSRCVCLVLVLVLVPAHLLVQWQPQGPRFRCHQRQSGSFKVPAQPAASIRVIIVAIDMFWLASFSAFRPR
jgi:hypothetical protein